MPDAGPRVGHAQDRALPIPDAVIPPHFLDEENAFLHRKEDSPHSLLHNTNATAELGPWSGTSASLDQPNACLVHDKPERTRHVTHPSVPQSHALHLAFMPLQCTFDDNDSEGFFAQADRLR